MFIPLTSKTIVPFTPPSMIDEAHEAGTVAPVFQIGVPTPGARDQLTARLMAMGLNSISEQLVRMTIVDELWTMFDEEEAEKLATMLDSVWQREAVQQHAVSLWAEQEEQRIADELAGAPPREPAPLPPRIIGIREEASMTLTIDRVINASQRVRDLLAERIDFQRRNAVLLVRMHVVGVNGLGIKEPFVFKQDALDDASASAIREKMPDIAWAELVAHIDRMYILDGSEEKNFASPLGKPSSLNGLHAPSGDLANSDGNSTTSNIIPLPTAASETITAPSSPSTLETDPAMKSDGPTAAA